MADTALLVTTIATIITTALTYFWMSGARLDREEEKHFAELERRSSKASAEKRQVVS